MKGKTSEAVFRARVKTTQTAEAMSVSLPMAGAALLVVESDGYFKGRNKKLKANFIIDAWPAAAKNGSVANLTFSPAAPGPRDRFPEALNPCGGRGAGWFTSAPRVCLAPDNSFLQSS